MVTHTHLGHGAPIYHLASRRRPRAPGLPRLRPGHRDRPGRDPAADHRAGRAARLRDRRGPSDRLRPLPRTAAAGEPRSRRDVAQAPQAGANRLRPMESPLLNAAGAVQADGPDAGVAAHYGDPMRGAARAGRLGRAGGPVQPRRAADHRPGPAELAAQPDHPAPGGAGGRARRAQALILSPTGHVEHHLTLTDDGTALWVHVEPGTGGALLAFLESMRFMLRVEVGRRQPGLRGAHRDRARRPTGSPRGSTGCAARVSQARSAA